MRIHTARPVRLPGRVDLWTRIIDFTDPWTQPPVVVLVHGTAETGEAFRQWIPHLARDFRLVCPDLRGNGRSTGIAPGTALSMDDLVGDVAALMRALEVPRYAVVGEKVGALLSLKLAGTHPEAVSALVIACGMISPREVLGGWIPDWIRLVEEKGSRAWADLTQAGRMGDELSGEALEWWSAMMGATAPADLVAYLRMLEDFALSEADLRAVRAPTQFLVPARATPSGGAFDQRRPADETRAWQALVRDHRVAAIDSASYHLSATRPDACAIATREFLLEHLDPGKAAS